MSADIPNDAPQHISQEQFIAIVQEGGKAAEEMYSYIKGLEDKAATLDEENKDFREHGSIDNQSK